MALQDATQSFWRAGFAATSLDDLCEATGLNRPSLYGAFGDKRALYLAALDRYVEVARAVTAQALRDDVSIVEALREVYDRALALYFADPKAPLGCFLIGTAATEAARDPAVRAKLGAGLRELTRNFEKRFRIARENGEIAAASDPALLAALAGAVLHSIALRARAGDSRASLRDFSRAAVRLLCDRAATGPGCRKRTASRSAGRRRARRASG